MKLPHIPLRPPSLATSIAVLALVVATTGTAAAATGQLVNIVDPAHANRKARVDATGNLKVTSTPALPTPFTRLSFPPAKFNVDTVVSANSSTVALNHVRVSNYFKQINGTSLEVQMSIVASKSDGSCSGPGMGFLSYDVPNGQTVVDPFPTPLVIKPLTDPAYPDWCILATTELQDLSASYYRPTLSIQGYVVSGSISPTVATTAPRGATRTDGGWYDSAP